MKRIVFGLATAWLISACGGSAPYFQHTVPDKKVAAVSGDGAMRIEQARGEVARAKDAFNAGDFEVRAAKKDVDAGSDRSGSASDRVASARSR